MASTAGEALEADVWVVTASGAPTDVMKRGRIEVPAPAANEVRVAVDASSASRRSRTVGTPNTRCSTPRPRWSSSTVAYGNFSLVAHVR